MLGLNLQILVIIKSVFHNGLQIYKYFRQVANTPALKKAFQILQAIANSLKITYFEDLLFFDFLPENLRKCVESIFLPDQETDYYQVILPGQSERERISKSEGEVRSGEKDRRW